MKAIQLEAPKTFRNIDIAEPAAPGKDEALVRVRRIGICGTDIPVTSARCRSFLSRVPGHELGVEVLAVVGT